MRTLTMAAAVSLLLTALLDPRAGATQASPAAHAPDRAPAADEFAGPFASWGNVREQYGAVGDGVADDTSAFQTALDRLGPETMSPVLFVPAGTYRITRTLSLNYPLGVGIVGEDPERVRLVWDGAAGGTMLVARGMAYSRINRLTFDGRRKASVAVEQTWDNAHGSFDTGNEYADDRFVDVEYGIRGGFEGFGFAETSVVRSHFVRNARAGIALGNFNALDLWVWYSLFEDCGVGVTNDPGAGNYRVYHSVFRRSTIADLQMQNTGGFTARGNYSIGSKAFWISGPPINHPATIDIEDNTIVDPVGPLVVRMGNQGPALLMDNRVRSLPKTAGPVVSWSSLFGADVVSIGNTFTVSNPVSANGRLVTLDDRILTREGIATGPPSLPSTPRNVGRRLYEVPVGASVEALQRTIDRAAAEGGDRPIVHLPFGRYALDRTLVVPAGNVQLVGDGLRTTLRWSGSGPGPIVSLRAPTRATLRELQIEGDGSVDGVVAEAIDRPGSRVYSEGTQLRGGRESNLFVDGAGRANVQMVDFGHAYSPRGTSVRVVGGSAAAAADAGKTVIYSGASSGHHLSYEVSDRGMLVARDIWYEGSADGGFLHLARGGSATLQGTRVATPGGWTPPAFAIDTDAGRFTILTTLFDDRIVMTGAAAGHADVLALSNLREEGELSAFTNSSAAPAKTVMLNLRQRTKAGGLLPRGTLGVPDIGSLDTDFIRAMLRDVRALPEPSLEPVPAGATDLRLFRVWIVGSANNLVLRGGTR